MEEYYLLFALAFIWTITATIQDIKKREVANWLNFSLIAFALAYRAFYAIHFDDYKFFLFGLAGFIIFFALAHAFYYGKVFAGGDAKLLMGYGVILPYTSYSSLAYLSLLFLFSLFFIGALYSLIYSLFIVVNNKEKFKKNFNRKLNESKSLQILALLIFALLLIIGTFYPLSFILSILFLTPLLYLYTKSLDVCMVSLLPPSKLTEGDWLEKSVKINSKLTIEKSVHGLSKEDIDLLKKYKKSVNIKGGIPFVPAFLLTLLILIYTTLFLKLSFDTLLNPLL
jgi:Flp pilus assembly protein protease CpaA